MSKALFLNIYDGYTTNFAFMSPLSGFTIRFICNIPNLMQPICYLYESMVYIEEQKFENFITWLLDKMLSILN